MKIIMRFHHLHLPPLPATHFLPPPSLSLTPTSFICCSTNQEANSPNQTPHNRASQIAPSLADVENALGIETTASSRSSASKSGVDNAKSTVAEQLTKLSEWLAERTEREEDGVSGLKFLLAFLIVWVCLLLLASGAIQLPVDIPFLQLK